MAILIFRTFHTEREAEGEGNRAKGGERMREKMMEDEKETK